MKIEEKCRENKQKNLRTSSEYGSSRQGKSKTRLAVSSEGKQETAVGSEQNRSKIATKERKSGSGRSSTRYCKKKTAHHKHRDRFRHA